MSGYKEFSKIELFIKSALKTGSDVHILYNNINASIINSLSGKYQKAKFISYDSYFSKHNINNTLSPFNLKYIILYLYMKHYLKDQYEYIMFSDVNDVYIQSNPFVKGYNDINAFAERLKIGQCITNALWCVQSYGYKQLTLDYDKPIINSGVVIIKHSCILNFLKEFLGELTKMLGRVKLDIGDQVTFTYFYNNILKDRKDVTIYSFPDEVCVHLAQDVEMRDIHERINFKEGKIYYNDIAPCILHQYNRYPTLEQYLLNLS